MTIDELIAALEALPASAHDLPVWARNIHGRLVPVGDGGVGVWHTDTGVVIGIEGLAES